MKTSFARIIEDLSQEKAPGDRIFTDAAPHIQLLATQVSMFIHRPILDTFQLVMLSML